MFIGITARVDPFYLSCMSHRWCVPHGVGMDAPRLSLSVLAPDLEVGKYIGEVLTLVECEPVWVRMEFNWTILAQCPSALKHWSGTSEKGGVCLIKNKEILLLSVKNLPGRY